MGHIDSDAHVYETDATWDYLDPDERDYRPRTLRDPESKSERWIVNGQLITRGDRFNAHDDSLSRELYPPGVTSLADVAARLAHMDRLGVDIQVVYSTFFISANVPNPLVEAALARSWNRWMADRYAESNGRIRWALRAPLRMLERAAEEMQFGKENGGVAVHIEGQIAGLAVDDPYLFPIYARAQDLDLAISVHVGMNNPGYSIPDVRNAFEVITPVPLGFHRLCVGDLHRRFPRLRWAFLEAGASWIPFILNEAARANANLVRSQERQVKDSLMWDNNLFVACQIDDDIPYLLQFAGSDNLVMGTDYGHVDIGSDLNAGEIIRTRPDLDSAVADKIVNYNGRRLYGIRP